MQFPLSFWDISLWLAVTAIILLITSELLVQSSGKTKFPIEKKRLRNATYVIGISFIFTIIIRIYELLIST
jgi:hypothetical protein